MNPKKLLIAGAAAVVVIVGVTRTGGDPYEVQLVMPSAAQLSERTPVWIKGHHAGEVKHLAVKNDKAVVTIALDDDFGRLHDGTTSRVEWVSAIGERVLTVYPGSTKNAAIPDGSYLETKSDQVEVDQVLATLDAPTRKRLSSLIGGLNSTVNGRELDLKASIHSASGTVNALGEVLKAIGEDGPAVRSLVTEISHMTEIAASRRKKLAATVSDLDAVTGAVADDQEALSGTISKLPKTLRTARRTLGKVPAASDSTVSLLNDLRPAAGKLPGVAADLAPTLVDLRPTVAALRPLLVAADTLLDETPGLLDVTHQVLPSIDRLIGDLGPAISFLRPYAPEGVGGLGNWGQAFAPYDGAGHTWAGLLAPGTNAVDESPVPLPLSRQNPAPKPGQPVGQSWTDATGSDIK
ncbi:MAG: Mammalian cell entry related domain protein [Aeromicrobium sp.]|uniref:MlaD family protein n=1 Tax=Aeromicrobium sp. TaxID=1871063 RepID=UPI00263119DD|nr:MlaD family protein [Aeromicrobium sp.]MCW2789617.1 Mammalian cell entry related domain protein [Aeromicrobium sp.]MCW2824992.1 Mammalian cell entry related domain protein [Aeromicrobium sp.]